MCIRDRLAEGADPAAAIAQVSEPAPGSELLGAREWFDPIADRALASDAETIAAPAAAVIAATHAIAQLGLRVQVTTYACMAENLPSADAYRPSDVLTIYGGTTVENYNTCLLYTSRCV